MQEFKGIGNIEWRLRCLRSTSYVRKLHDQLAVLIALVPVHDPYTRSMHVGPSKLIISCVIGEVLTVINVSLTQNN